MRKFIWLVAVLISAMGFATDVAVAETNSATAIAANTSPAYKILPASILRAEGIELVADNLVESSNWQGLVCSAQGCELRAAKLIIQEQSGQGNLHISYSPANKRARVKGEFTIAFLSTNPNVGQKIIPTWFTLRAQRTSQDAENGSLGITINTPDHGDYHLVPRWNKKANDKYLTLNLENQQQRQRLGIISLDALNEGLKTRDILIWAGDMDGDGKIDLITRVSKTTSSGGLHLWLSSHAEKGDMLGIAAELENWSDFEEQEGC